MSRAEMIDFIKENEPMLEYVHWILPRFTDEQLEQMVNRIKEKIRERNEDNKKGYL